MSYIRTAITDVDEDISITLLKPFSDEHRDKLFVIHEDAYGKIEGILTPINEIRRKFDKSDEEFKEILKKLDF